MRRVAVVAIVGALVGGCQCGPSKPCNTQSDCDPGYVCAQAVCQASAQVDGGSVGDAGAGGGGGTTLAMPVRLEVTPATSTLQSINGSQPTQAFATTVFFDDGTSMPASAVDLSVDVPAIGTIIPNGGPFTASGLVGGEVTVTARVVENGQTLSGTARVRVQLEQTFAPVGAPGDLASRFATPAVVDATRAANVVYPLDGVVFPQNVAPADVQWLNGTTGDWFRVRLVKPDMTLTAYTEEDGNHHLLLSLDGWRALAQTNGDVTTTLEVSRLEKATGQVVAGAPRALRFAKGSLSGSVYYWDIVRGRIVRIDDGTTMRTEFMPNPPRGVDGESCVGCHSVSPSGRYMAGRLGGGDNVGGVFDLTADLTGNPAASVWPIRNSNPETPRWYFSSFSPDETRLVISRSEMGNAGRLGFLDPQTGQVVNVANIPALRTTHPAWSPDGTRIAYVELSSGWGGDSTGGDIGLVPVTGDTLGVSTVIHRGAALSGDVPTGNADAYPSWTPDSKWLAFSHGTNNRSELPSQSALYLMRADGSDVRRLSKGSGGAAATDSFQPRFSPFRAGGYFWMSFLSRRDYGNAQVGTRGTQRQQIWVCAISDSPTPGTDASEVGYWLPGQNTQSRNIAAYWAPRACRQQGSQCTVGSECCSGNCSLTGGRLQCDPPPPDRCHRENETCGGSGDCCMGMGLVCKQNICTTEIG